VDVTARLAPVLEIAAKNALDVDVEGRYPAEAVQALRESGLLGLTVPTEAGGLGGGPHELVATVGALAGVCGSTAMIYLMHVSAVMPVAVAPPPDLPKLLTQLADGSTLGSLAFSEAGSRSHFWAPVSKATRDGDTVRLQARKSWVTSAGKAEVYVVSTGSADVEGGVDLFAVPSDTPGLEVAGPWTGMGLRGNASSPMTIDAQIPVEHRLGEAGKRGATRLGFALLLKFYTRSRQARRPRLVCRTLYGATRGTTGRPAQRPRSSPIGDPLADQREPIRRHPFRGVSTRRSALLYRTFGPSADWSLLA